MYSYIMRNRLIEERKRAGYSQAQLADLIGLDRSLIGKMEAGLRKPDIETVGQLMEFYEVSIDWLFGQGQRELPHKVEQLVIDEIASGAFVLSLLASLSNEEMKVFFSGQMKYSRFLQDEKFKSLSQKQQIHLYQEYQNKEWNKREDVKN